MDAARALASLPQFQEIDADLRRRLATGAHVLEAPAGAVLLRPGDAAEAFLVVLDGRIRVGMTNEDGKEVLLYRLGPGEACLLTTACLLAGGRYAAVAKSESAVHALAIPAPLFREALDLDPAFRHFVFGLFNERLGALMAVIDRVAFQRIDRRLAAALLARAAGSGQGLRVTHHELAAELGTAREVVSRQLKVFERAGWLRLARGRIEILDPRSLESLAGPL